MIEILFFFLGFIAGFALCLKIHWPLTSFAYILTRSPFRLGEPVAVAKEMCERGWASLGIIDQKVWTPYNLFDVMVIEKIITEEEKNIALRAFEEVVHPAGYMNVCSECILSLAAALILTRDKSNPTGKLIGKVLSWGK